ncbi:hypothetical protein RRF57_004650 [Xylaria bambusicola]|uniref:Uncharacterized protein n=1 Tax=Xylaria bambusicola TaxID=326684 RepID=A0AAN7UM65_9PEZI
MSPEPVATAWQDGVSLAQIISRLATMPAQDSQIIALAYLALNLHTCSRILEFTRIVEMSNNLMKIVGFNTTRGCDIFGAHAS